MTSMATPGLILLVTICFIVQVHGSMQCESGWSRYGGKCYKVFEQKLSYTDSASLCKRYGSQVADIYGYKRNKFVGKLLSNLTGTSSAWIATRDQADGFWSTNEPSNITSPCFSLQDSPSQRYEYTWSTRDCVNTQLAVICSQDACASGSFRCFNGKCITNTPCDDSDDCGDNSDESDCSTHCTHVLTSPGSFSSPSYSSSQCRWTLVGPVGSRVQLEFTSFVSEMNSDMVSVWSGQRTLNSEAQLLATLTGNQASNVPLIYYSSNNMMVVTFTSDTTVIRGVFNAVWSEMTVHTGQAIAATTTPTNVQSPSYGQRVLPGLHMTWPISTSGLRKVITLQVQDIDIGDNGILEIYDGLSENGVLLATLTSRSQRSVVVSTLGQMKVVFKTGDSVHNGKGLKFTVREGCYADIVANYGYLTSPGYPFVNYPDNQLCRFTIESVNKSRPLYMYFSDFALIDNPLDTTDYVMVEYYNANATLQNSTTPSPDNIFFSNNSMVITMFTGPSLNAKGFNASFSTGCDLPPLTTGTVFSSTNGDLQSFMNTITFSCSNGYTFASNQFANQASIVATCLQTGWNVTQIPLCRPVYCGEAPLVANGYAFNSSGVEFSDTVEYKCFGGYNAANLNISCQSDGTWQTAPVCEVQLCSQPVAPASSTITNIEGNGTTYASIIEVTCITGYQYLVTASNSPPRMICQQDGQWSSDPANVICQKSTCPVHEVANGNITSYPLLPFGDISNLTCHAGFQAVGPTSTECLDNNLLSSAFGICQDIDECATNNGGCFSLCTNTIGSFVCSCASSFNPDPSNSSSCIDIDECTLNTANCAQTCTNTLGGYTCSCDLTGFVLFTSNGTENSFIAPGDTGLKAGDVLYLNHSCVRTMCAAQTPPSNGGVYNNESVLYYGDMQHFYCDIGYTLVGDSNSSCTTSNAWSSPVPSCSRAFCVVPDVSSLGDLTPTLNPASGQVNYLENMTSDCSNFLDVPVNRTHTCMYDPVTAAYEFFSEVADVSCPVIDCGIPEPIPGANFSSTVNNLLGATFDVTCKTRYSMSGSTNHSSSNSTVECMANGLWQFGSIYCFGASCDDPGIPGNAIITATSFNEPSIVTYNCSRDGYRTDTYPYQKTCTVTASSIDWSPTGLPTCVDYVPPTITNCPVSTISVSLLGQADYAIPTALDNTGVTSVSVTPTATLPLHTVYATSQNITYVALDAAGNQDSCMISIIVTSKIQPTVTCLFTKDILMTNTDVNQSVSSLNIVTTDAANTIVYTPEHIEANMQDVHSKGAVYTNVKTTVTSITGEVSTCMTVVTVKASPCQYSVFNNSENVDYSCSTSANTVTCSLSCVGQTFFYEGTIGKTLTCDTSSSGWDFTGQVNDQLPHCQAHDSYASYVLSASINYTLTNNDFSPSCLVSYLNTLKASQFVNIETKFTANILLSFGLTVTSVIDDASATLIVDSVNPKLAILQYDIRITASTPVKESTFKGIQSTYDTALKFRQTIYGTNQLETVTANSCETMLIVPVTTYTSTDVFLCPTSMKLITETLYKGCLSCPYGSFASGDVCSVCPIGKFTSTVGASSCTDCPSGKSTAANGTGVALYCKDICSQFGFVSATNVQPCQGCPADQFFNSTSNVCQTCGSGAVTNGQSAKDFTQCQAACQTGYFSDNGNAPCRACPIGYYQDAVKQSNCIACVTSKTTATNASTAAVDCVDSSILESSLCSCLNGGTCNYLNHLFTCTCAPGYTGTHCEVVINQCDYEPCVNGGTCSSSVNAYNCTCVTGFTGTNCEILPNNCNGVTCLNGGKCLNKATSFECICNTGFTGTTCDQTEEICVQAPCQNGGVCVKLNSQKRQCHCLDGYSGLNCQTINDNCARHPCYNGATCVNQVDAYTCTCAAGFSGPKCTDRVDVCQAANCNGKCVADLNNDVVCVCDQGFYDPSNKTNTEIEYIHSAAFNSCTAYTPCQLQPCQNNATCQSQPDGQFSCSCLPGFAGHLCQHDYDECLSNPCSNISTCVDVVNGYNCICPSGLSGDTCSVDINECSPALTQCNSTGTALCQETTLAGYNCTCNPGYTGVNCEIEIDECLSDPCINGGNCTQGIDSFTCVCPLGYEGVRCQNFTSSCNSTACQNNAQCYNIFNSAFCKCAASSFTFGDKCELSSDVCRYANPCINNSTCSADSNSTTTCACNSVTTGAGCEQTIDFCDKRNMCMNGGTCRTLLDDFRCDCLNGFTGKRCQEVKNGCGGVTCPQGQCTEARGRFFCPCSVDKTGDVCDKDIFDNFDLVLRPVDSEQPLAELPIPFLFNNKSNNEFTIGFYIRMAKEIEPNSSFLTLYSLESRDFNDVINPLMKLSRNSVELSFPGFNDTVTHGFAPPYELPFPAWYYVSVTWSSSTGTLEVRRDGVRLVLVTDYATGYTLQPFGWITIGCDYDISTSACSPSSIPFDGIISQLQVWNRNLDPTNEISVLSASRSNKVTNDLVQMWTNYEVFRGSRYLHPSTAGDTVCLDGFSDPTAGCSVVVTRKSIPTIACPADVFVISSLRQTIVTWNQPSVAGTRLMSPSSTYSSGDMFLWGSYVNIYVVRDDNNNYASCSFNIFVRRDNCEMDCSRVHASNTVGGSDLCSNSNPLIVTPTSPANVSANFDLTCSDPAKSQINDSPKFMTCGPSGTWNPEQPLIPPQWPMCSNSSVATSSVVISIVYDQLDKCSINIIPIQNAIYVWLDNLNSKWGTSQASSSGGFCGSGSCNANSKIAIALSCPTSSSRRRRAASQTLSVTVNLNDLVALLTNSNGDTATPHEIVMAAVLASVSSVNFAVDNGVNVVNIPNAIPLDSSTTVASTSSCPQGYMVLESLCVKCLPGTFGVNSTCSLCPKSTYQSAQGSTSCLDCPGSETTETVASIDASQCHVSCPIGQYFNVTTDACVECPLGFYQPQTGTFVCQPCPVAQTTAAIGATNSSQCTDICGAGMEASSDNSCQNCTRGYYRSLGVGDSLCQSCPVNTTTLTIQSTSASDCNQPDCPEGSFVNASICQPCPFGSYRPVKWQSQCIQCQSGYNTLAEGSILASECRFSCPAGQEEDPNNALTCRQCVLGKFKMDNRPTTCTSCMDGTYTTASTGAISNDLCTIKICSIGQQPMSSNTSLCESCPIATFQNVTGMTSCNACPVGTSTRSVGANDPALCVPYCPAGQETNATLNVCQPCQQGFYRNNNNIDAALFESCLVCPSEFTTPSIGSESALNCTQKNCTLGEKYSNPEKTTCSLCPIGTYQDTLWQSDCINCGTNKTTELTGRTSSSECLLNCPSGFGYDSSGAACMLCIQGTYRKQDILVTDGYSCNNCTNGLTTRTSGAILASECDIAFCPAGTKYFDSTRQSCLGCPRGSYQNQSLQFTCDPCPGGMDTQFENSTRASDCKRTCNPGYQLDAATDACLPCPRGTYKNDQFSCQDCPVGLITPTAGAIFDNQCTMANCSAGSYINGTNCAPCPIGSYQPDKWQSACISCGLLSTTMNEGAVNVSQCNSTDYCNNGMNTCAPASMGGVCVSLTSSPWFNCSCQDSYVASNGSFCQHKCDQIPSYCKNGGTCDRSLPKIYCTCTSFFDGDTCELKKEFDSNTKYIIIGSITGVVGALALFFVVVYITYMKAPLDAALLGKGAVRSYNPSSALRSSMRSSMRNTFSGRRPIMRGSTRAPGSVFSAMEAEQGGQAFHTSSRSANNPGGYVAYQKNQARFM